MLIKLQEKICNKCISSSFIMMYFTFNNFYYVTLVSTRLKNKLQIKMKTVKIISIV